MEIDDESVVHGATGEPVLERLIAHEVKYLKCLQSLKYVHHNVQPLYIFYLCGVSSVAPCVEVVSWEKLHTNLVLSLLALIFPPLLSAPVSFDCSKLIQ